MGGLFLYTRLLCWNIICDEFLRVFVLLQYLLYGCKCYCCWRRCCCCCCCRLPLTLLLWLLPAYGQRHTANTIFSFRFFVGLIWPRASSMVRLPFRFVWLHKRLPLSQMLNIQWDYHYTSCIQHNMKIRQQASTSMFEIVEIQRIPSKKYCFGRTIETNTHRTLDTRDQPKCDFNVTHSLCTQSHSQSQASTVKRSELLS